jgi:hypothetical protein
MFLSDILTKEHKSSIFSCCLCAYGFDYLQIQKILSEILFIMINVKNVKGGWHVFYAQNIRFRALTEVKRILRISKRFEVGYAVQGEGSKPF